MYASIDCVVAPLSERGCARKKFDDALGKKGHNQNVNGGGIECKLGAARGLSRKKLCLFGFYYVDFCTLSARAFYMYMHCAGLRV